MLNVLMKILKCGKNRIKFSLTILNEGNSTTVWMSHEQLDMKPLNSCSTLGGWMKKDKQGHNHEKGA